MSSSIHVQIPLAGAAAPVVATRPVRIPAPGRGDDLQVRVAAPVTGEALPIVLFSHGYGWSMDGYAPLADFWAARGLVVIQPTHLDSRALGLAPEDPRTPHIWRHRVEDLRRSLDEIDRIAASVPGLRGRIDRTRIAVAGHSWGAQTASMLLGARILDSQGRPGEDLSDPRVGAGVLLAVPGTGGSDLTPFAAEHFPFMNPTFAGMTARALVVHGDQDRSLLSVRGPGWWTDAYVLAPGPKSLLTLFGAEHSLGGVAGVQVAETTDESPDRIALVQQVTCAYLQSALGVDDRGWAAATALLADGSSDLGRIESR